MINLIQNVADAIFQSIALQTGKPFMIERTGFIESIESWCKDPMAIPNDLLLGALVSLRLLSSEVYRLLGPRSSRVHAGELHTLESLLAIIDGRIEEWEMRWLTVVDQGTPLSPSTGKALVLN